MKFKCFCGNVINTTSGSCKEACVLHTKSEYILWIKFMCDLIPMKEFHDFKRTFFCDECRRYSVFDGEDLYVFKPSPVETIQLNDYETYHLMDECECDEIGCVLDDPQKRNEIIKSDFNSLPKTRMMNISFTEKKAYIENLDGSIETYVIDHVVKR
ncbi:MAG: hypothetical protein K2J72_02205 [Oscillospiraceae bacterium]|nr:hypothetical protein [Oscillospiraceae bacterium]